MSNRYMLTLMGEDRPSIVARVTQILYETGCNLGEASMMRLGTSFSMMLLIDAVEDAKQLQQTLQTVADELGLILHIDSAQSIDHGHQVPDVCITVHGADRAGIVAQVTSASAEAGLNIIDLASDVGGTTDAPLYVLHIEGVATQGVEALEKVLMPLQTEGIKVDVRAIDTLIG
ncbi:MAG: ACT domain-containing protein [Gammaproteobacteria bacterium]